MEFIPEIEIDFPLARNLVPVCVGQTLFSIYLPYGYKIREQDKLSAFVGLMTNKEYSLEYISLWQGCGNPTGLMSVLKRLTRT